MSKLISSNTTSNSFDDNGTLSPFVWDGCDLGYKIWWYWQPLNTNNIVFTNDNSIKYEICYWQPLITNNVVSTSDNSIKYKFVENDKEFICDIVMPGLVRENFNIKFIKGTLEVTVSLPEKKDDIDKNNSKVIHDNLVDYNKAKIVIAVDPEVVDYEKSSASYNAGILTISIPKNDSSKNKTFEIQVK